jgi:hypothetical protein
MNIQKRFLFLFVLLISFGAVSAQTKSDVFNKDIEVTWLGLDFSNAKFLGDR